MKAVVCSREHGLIYMDVPMPEMSSHDIVVRVANTGVCGSDVSFIKNGFFREGTILGHEISAVVHAVGTSVSNVSVGQRVIMRPTYCGKCRYCTSGLPHFCPEFRRVLGVRDLPGGFAEYIRVLPQMLIPIPEGVDSRNAALAEVFASAYHGLRCSGCKGGSALVMGGGPIGLAMVSILKLHGFSPIVLSEPVAEKRRVGALFGADKTLDPFCDNLGYHAFDMTNDVGFDAIFECSGIRANVELALDFIGIRGTITVVSVINAAAKIPLRRLTFTEAIITASISNTHEENRQVLHWMAEDILDGHPMISDLIALRQLPDIFRSRVLTGHSTKVMLQIGEEF